MELALVGTNSSLIEDLHSTAHAQSPCTWITWFIFRVSPTSTLFNDACLWLWNLTISACTALSCEVIEFFFFIMFPFSFIWPRKKTTTKDHNNLFTDSCCYTQFKFLNSEISWKLVLRPVVSLETNSDIKSDCAHLSFRNKYKMIRPSSQKSREVFTNIKLYVQKHMRASEYYHQPPCPGQ